mgnify:CR=1
MRVRLLGDAGGGLIIIEIGAHE